MLLDRVDPFIAEFDRLTQRAFGATDGVGLPMDVVRRTDELVVTVDLPGVPAEQISVNLENRMLTIGAERRSAYGEGEAVLLQERFDGAVSVRGRVAEFHGRLDDAGADVVHRHRYADASRRTDQCASGRKSQRPFGE